MRVEKTSGAYGSKSNEREKTSGKLRGRVPPKIVQSLSLTEENIPLLRRSAAVCQGRGSNERDILENQSTTASGLDEADLLVTPRRLAKTGALSFWTMTFQFVCVRVQTVRKSARAWQACSSLLPSLGWPLVKKLSKGLKRLELCHLVSHGEV